MAEKICFRKFGVMIDCSRNAVMNVSAFKKMVNILSSLGYNTVRLYTEDTYEVDGEPYFGYLRGRYTKAELREMDEYAAERGVELIPCIQTLAHLGAIFRYVEYGKIKDIDDILLVGEERTYELIEHMFHSLSECFSSRNVHIGMDEAFMLGKGKYLEKNGLEDRALIIKKHLDRVLGIAERYGFACEIWGDMYMHSAYGGVYEHTKDDAERVAKLVPEKLKLCYWDYYHTEVSHYEECIEKHRKLTKNISFAGGAWTWTGFCPNDRYSMKITEAAVKACRNKGVDEVYFTMWGDNGGECSPFGVLPVLVAASEFAKNNFDMRSIRETFREKVGMDYDLFCALEAPDKVYSEPDAEADCDDPSKVMLFTDPFCGIFDARVREGIAPRYYREASELLKKGEENGEWGYLFKSLRALCGVLEVKFDLGVKTRKAYKANDKAALKKIVETDYALLLKRLDSFYDAFEAFWIAEKKPFGFEVQDIRLGGVKQRVAHCKRRLENYLAGKEKSIPELEEEILQPLGMSGRGVGYNYYGVLPTVNGI